VVDPKLELCVGGACDLTMRGPDGTEMRMHAVYREIERPNPIVRRRRSLRQTRGVSQVKGMTIRFAACYAR
jgi:uncharacterized protein YndB with AHSA1/START domain